MNDDSITHLASKCQVTEGPLDFCLGMSVTRDKQKRTIELGQEALLDKLSDKFQRLSQTSTRNSYNVPLHPDVDLPKESMPAVPDHTRIDDARSAMGTTLHLALKTRPDLAQQCFCKAHLVSTKQVRYAAEHFHPISEDPAFNKPGLCNDQRMRVVRRWSSPFHSTRHTP